MKQTVAVLSAALLTGCVYGSPLGYEDVLKIGDTEAIRKWTLQQPPSSGSLVGGEEALAYLVAVAPDDGKAEEAIKAYLDVVRSIQRRPDSESAVREKDFQLAVSVVGQAVWDNPRNRYLPVLFRRLRPTQGPPQWFKIWDEERNQVKERLAGERT